MKVYLPSPFESDQQHKVLLHCQPCKMSDTDESVLGQLSPVSVCGHRVRLQVRCATVRHRMV